MLGSDRRNVLKAGLIAASLLAVLATVALIAWGLSKSAEYERESRYYRAKYAADAEHEIRQSCLLLSPIEQVDCISKAYAGQREGERGEQDLVAQRQSALWAYIMGAAAVFGMSLSIVGVVLVWVTFRETKLSNEIANKALDGQLRPWIGFEFAKRRIEFSDHRLCVTADIKFMNYGDSPALYLSYACKMDTERRESDLILNWFPQELHGLWENAHDRTLFPSQPWERTIHIDSEPGIKGIKKVSLIIAAKYKSPYADDMRFTVRIFDLRHFLRPDGTIDIENTAELHCIDVEEREILGGIAT